MDEAHYDAKRDRILITPAYPYVGLTPGSVDCALIYENMFPREVEMIYSPRRYLQHYALPPRADVIRLLRQHVRPRETPEFTELAQRMTEMFLTETKAAQENRTATVPFLPTFADKTLYPVQTRAIDAAIRHRYMLFAITMGVGKTLTSLYAAVGLLAKGDVKKWLVLAPRSVLSSTEVWHREMSELHIPHRVIGHEAEYHHHYPFILTSPQQLIHHLDSRTITLRDLAQFDGIIYDESTSLGNPANRVHRLIRELRPRLNALFELNGTAIETGAEQLYWQLDLLRPRRLGSWDAFRQRHGIQDGRRPFPAASVRALQEEMVDMMFVASLEDIGKELPPLIVENLWVPLAPEQQAIYDALSERLLHCRDSGERLRLLVRIQQVCNDVGLCSEGEYVPNQPSTKREALRQLMPGLSCFGRKSLIYSQYRQWVSALASDRTDGGAPMLYAGGGGKQRDWVRDRFTHDPDELFMWVTDAGKKGLNLPFVWNILSLDLPYGGSIYQLPARARRGDTDHPVFWFRLLSDTPYERNKLAIVEARRELLETHVYTLPEALAEGVFVESELAVA